MTTKELNQVWLWQYLDARRRSPWVASYAESRVRQSLQDLGGMAGSWRTDYPECTYYHPCRIDEELVDLSNVSKVRQFYESKPLPAQ